jgi:hypothetical protein
MAAPRKEIDIITEGMALTDPYNNQTFIQNLYKNRGLYETRDGFGTLMEFNAPLTARITGEFANNEEFGLRKHLGSYSFVTDFGHEQIVSIFLARGWTGYKAESGTDYLDYYCVNIYDVTTNNFWQEVLYDHTAEQEKTNQTTGYYRGFLEARPPLLNYSNVKEAKSDDFFFSEYLGKVYFGSKESGVFIYNPAAFITNRDKRVNNLNSRDHVWSSLTNQYSETSLITPISFKDGLFTDAYAYITDDELSGIVDLDANDGRIVYASGRSIYFSDIGVSNAIIGDNTFTFHELRSDITAIKTFNEMVIVWSKDQTFIYQPSQGVLLTAGRMTEVHSEIGCLGPNAVLFRQNKIFWVDDNGIYSTGTGFSAEEVSLAIKRFFTDSTVNPFIHYFTANGFVGTDLDSPDFVYRFRDNTSQVHLTYDEVYEQLMLVVPELNLVWIYKNGWYLWSFTSIVESEPDGAGGFTYKVSGNPNISSPWLTSTQTKTFAVGGNETKQIINKTVSREGLPTSQNIGVSKSWRLFQWGKGGALDGSTRDFDEGKRTIGFYDGTEDSTNNTVWFDPLERWGNKLSADVTQGTTYTEEDELWYLPIYFTTNQADHHQVLNFQLEFSYDTSKYQTVPFAGAGDDSIVFMLPTERAVNYSGYSPGTIAGTAQVSDTTGNITIKFDASIPFAGGNTSYPYSNLNRYNKNPVIWIPFQKRNRNSTGDAQSSLIGGVTTAEYTYGITPPGTLVTPMNTIVWNPGYYYLETTDTRTTGIDWIYKSSQIGIEGQDQIKARGSYSSISSRGTGQPIKPWLFGPWNTVAGSDYKDYVTQLVDVTDDNINRAALVEVSNKNSIRTRFKPSVLEDRLLGTSALYGDNTNALEGNYLVDVEEVDTIATSDSVRGESVNYTFFGFLLDKASKLNIKTIKVALQAVAGRRRRGR